MFLIFLLLFVLIMYIWLMIQSSNEAGRIHKDLDEFQVIAEGLNTAGELRVLEVLVGVYKKKYCWHRHHTEHANGVLTYIKNRREYVARGEK